MGVLLVPENWGAESVIIPTPDEGILVIEQIAIHMRQEEGTKPYLYEVTTVTGTNYTPIPLIFPQAGGVNGTNLIFQGSQQVRLYTDLTKSNPLSIRYGRVPDTRFADGYIVVSGYIIPNDSPRLDP